MLITHFDFRFLRAAFSLAILALTASLGTVTTLRASLSNSLHPLGLLIKTPLLFSHKSSVLYSGEQTISQTPVENTSQYQTEPFSVCPFAVIETKNLFGYISEQVRRRNTNISASNTALEQRPEILNPVCVNCSPNISYGMVNSFVTGMAIDKTIVNSGFVRIDRDITLDNLLNPSQCSFGIFLLDNFGINSACFATLQNPVNRSLADSTTALNCFDSFCSVHIISFAADVGSIDFDRLIEFTSTINLHSFADSVKHKPSCALCNAYCSAKLVATDSVFTICDGPNRYEPLVEAERTVLKNRSDFGTELFAAVLATHQISSFNFAYSHTAAMGTNRRIASPANFPHIAFADRQIGKVTCCLQQGCWSIHNFLTKSQPPPTRQGAGLKNYSNKFPSSSVQQVIHTLFGSISPALTLSLKDSSVCPSAGVRPANFNAAQAASYCVLVSALSRSVVRRLSPPHKGQVRYVVNFFASIFLTLSNLVVINLLLTINSITHIGGVSTTKSRFFNIFFNQGVNPVFISCYET